MMKPSDVTRLLLLLLLHHSEAERFESDDAEVDDLRTVQVALTPPVNALPPKLAKLDAEAAADAAAIRQHAAKVKQNQWRKVIEADAKRKHGQQKQQHMQQEGEAGRQTGQEKEHHQGLKKLQPSANQQRAEVVDKDSEAEERRLTLLKNLAGKSDVSDDEEVTSQQQAEPSSSKRPSDVILEHANDTYTQRFYYVPVGGARSFPCLPDDVTPLQTTGASSVKRSTNLRAQFKSVEASWYDEHGKQVPDSGANQTPADSMRVSVNAGKNLTLRDARPDNTGRYKCIAAATVANDSVITVVNVLRINVYDYPDYVQLMSYPFRLSVACTTSLQDKMSQAGKAGFCSSHNDPCVFEFIASCFDSNDAQAKTGGLELTVIKRHHPDYQPPSCNEACVFRSKYRQILGPPIMDRDSVNKITAYDKKIFTVNKEWLEQRDPMLNFACGAGFQLQNYRCLSCFAGTYQPLRSSTAAVCTPCPVGEYQPHSHSDRCVTCPHGETTSDERSMSQDQCQADYLELIKTMTASKLFLLIFSVVLVSVTVICTIIARARKWWCFSVKSKDRGSDPSSKSPLLKTVRPPIFDRRYGLDSASRSTAAAHARSLGSVRTTTGPPPGLPRPSAIAQSPPPPPSTPSRRLQLAQTRHGSGGAGQQDIHRTLEQQVGMLEADLRRKRHIAAAATLASQTSGAGGVQGRNDRPRSTRASDRPSVGV